LNTVYFHPERLSSLRLNAEHHVGQQNFAGISWSVQHRDAIVNEGVAGFSDYALSEPLKSDAIYRIYSMTKPIVSVRVLQLLELGKLRLDSPISTWLPAFEKMSVLSPSGSRQEAKRQITVEDLLLHRSGLSYDFLPACPVAALYRDARLAADGSRSLSDLVDLLAEFPLAHQPGARWYYSYSTDVLAHLIEQITEQPVAENLAANIFLPLGMTETGFDVSTENQHRLASMYGLRELAEEDASVFTTNTLMEMDVEESYPVNSAGAFARGGMGLYSTIGDYQRFMSVLMNGNSQDGLAMLSNPMLDMLWQNRLSDEQMPIAIGDRSYNGYGWGLTGRVMADTSKASALSVAGEGARICKTWPTELYVISRC